MKMVHNGTMKGFSKVLAKTHLSTTFSTNPSRACFGFFGSAGTLHATMNKNKYLQGQPKPYFEWKWDSKEIECDEIAQKINLYLYLSFSISKGFEVNYSLRNLAPLNFTSKSVLENVWWLKSKSNQLKPITRLSPPGRWKLGRHSHLWWQKKGFVNGLYRLIRNVSFWQMKTY